MPVYTFKCLVCGRSHDELRTIANRDLPSPCPFPRCDGACERDVVESMRVNSTDQEYGTPLLSEALGVHPGQIKEAQKRFPHHEFHPDGRMIIRSHASRNRIMRELGFVDRDGFN